MSSPARPGGLRTGRDDHCDRRTGGYRQARGTAIREPTVEPIVTASHRPHDAGSDRRRTPGGNPDRAQAAGFPGLPALRLVRPGGALPEAVSERHHQGHGLCVHPGFLRGPGGRRPGTGPLRSLPDGPRQDDRPGRRRRHHQRSQGPGAGQGLQPERPQHLGEGRQVLRPPALCVCHGHRLQHPDAQGQGIRRSGHDLG